MAKDELNHSEKAGLLAVKDLANPDHYDKEFYKLLSTQTFPGVLEIDDQIRPAIVKFIHKERESLHLESEQPQIISPGTVETAMTMALLRGYELGRKLRRPLTAKPAASR